MKKEFLIVIAVIGGIFLLSMGFYLGLTYTQKQIEKAQTGSPLASLLASKVISGLVTTASGEVTEITGRNLTLKSNEDILVIPIQDNASINRLLSPEETATEVPQPVEREKIELGDIKVGDKVNISCQLKADGTLEGVDAMVLP